MHQICLMVNNFCTQQISVCNLFLVTSLNKTPSGNSIFGNITLLHPQSISQYLYCLSPNDKLISDVKSLSGATNIGKLDIVWRSNLGEKGRLQTSQLQRMVLILLIWFVLKYSLALIFRARILVILNCL